MIIIPLLMFNFSFLYSITSMLSFYADLFSDFDFTSNNQYIASSSLDKTVRVWEIAKGICMRVIYGVSSQLCIRFHPVSTIYGACVSVCIKGMLTF